MRSDQNTQSILELLWIGHLLYGDAENKIHHYSGTNRCARNCIYFSTKSTAVSQYGCTIFMLQKWIRYNKTEWNPVLCSIAPPHFRRTKARLQCSPTIGCQHSSTKPTGYRLCPTRPIVRSAIALV